MNYTDETVTDITVWLHEVLGEGPSEVQLRMLFAAGISAGEIFAAVDTWRGAYRVHGDWGYVRTVAWNEAVKRAEMRAELKAEMAATEVAG